MSMPAARPEILQLGPGLTVRGGISSVERLIVERLGASTAIRHVATMEDGSAWRKLRVFVRAVSVLRRELRTACGTVRSALSPAGARARSAAAAGPGVGPAADRPGMMLVHIHFSKRGSTVRKVLLAWMTLRAGQPLILHAHSGSFDRFFGALPVLARQVIGHVFARADRVIVLSRHWRDFYVQSVGLDPRRIVILSNPVAIPVAVPERAGRAQVQLLFLGRISGHKGAFDLLRAYATLPEALRSRTRLVFAGDGEVEALRAQAHAFGRAVEVHSWVDTTRRDALLASSDIFVLPSYYEGVPMAMLEAMAHGLAVVSTRVGGIPEVIQDQREGLLISPGAPAQLREALICLIENEDRRLAMGRQARQRAQGFDAHRYAARLLNVYEQVLQQHGCANREIPEEVM